MFFIKLACSLFTGVDNKIMYNNNIIYNIRGVNWFGMNTDCICPHGLWIHDTYYYLDQLHNLGFNSIRIPFSYEFALNMDQKLKYECTTADPYVQDFTGRKYLHHLFYNTAIRNMTILLDFHTINGKITERPYDYINQDLFLIAWKNIINEFGNYDNLIGVDIKNEPHGAIRWPEWANDIQIFIRYMNENIPGFKNLFFINGIEDPEDKSTWGGSFSNMETLLHTNPDSRIVFSPHVYGVSVRGYDSIYDNSFQWNTWFGFLKKFYNNPICIGEIGGWNVGPDYDWHENILKYLQSNKIQNFYYWSFNPNSIDTGGILREDWTTIDQSKISFCTRLQPNPTFIKFH